MDVFPYFCQFLQKQNAKLTAPDLQMTSECVEVEELAGFVAIAASLHLTTEQDVTTQQADLSSHVHTVHLLTHVDELSFTCTSTHTHTHTSMYTHNHMQTHANKYTNTDTHTVNKANSFCTYETIFPSEFFLIKIRNPENDKIKI